MTNTLESDKSELDVCMVDAHPYLKKYVQELQKEIARLHRQNAQQEVVHLSALERLKAKHEQELVEAEVRSGSLSPEEAYKRFAQIGGANKRS